MALSFRLLALGQLALLERRPREAADLLRESLRLSREQALTDSSVLCLAALATVALAHDAPLPAARLLAAAEAHEEAIGAKLFRGPPERELWQRTMAETRAVLAPNRLHAAWAQGRAMSLDEAVDYALSID